MSLSFGIFSNKIIKNRRKFAEIRENSSISPREKTIIIHRKDYEMILKERQFSMSDSGRYHSIRHMIWPVPSYYKGYQMVDKFTV